jgi:hypothetical protein
VVEYYFNEETQTNEPVAQQPLLLNQAKDDVIHPTQKTESQKEQEEEMQS